jgi:hypothetical protein
MTAVLPTPRYRNITPSGDARNASSRARLGSGRVWRYQPLGDVGLVARPPDPALGAAVSVEQVVGAKRERDGLVVVLPGVVIRPVDAERVLPTLEN